MAPTHVDGCNRRTWGTCFQRPCEFKPISSSPFASVVIPKHSSLGLQLIVPRPISSAGHSIGMLSNQHRCELRSWPLQTEVDSLVPTLAALTPLFDFARLRTQVISFHLKDALAERSKAVAQGAIPKGRGFEPHRRHFSCSGAAGGCS